MIAAAASALASGDALSALNYVALRNDPDALALRGIAMAQLGDLDRARQLLRRAAREFGAREPVARARCSIAETEIALVSRDLGSPAISLEAAAALLERRGDAANAAHARYLAIRRLALLGRLDEAESLINSFDPTPLPAASRAAYRLAVAGVAMRRLRVRQARAALAEAEEAARIARIPSLAAEVEQACLALEAPAARLVMRGAPRLLKLDDVEAVLASDALVFDACRHVVSSPGSLISLQTRPVLFALARCLAEAWPGAASRAKLLASAFRARHVDESHRARLRVEIGRLRKALAGVAEIEAGPTGFALSARAREVALLEPPTDEPQAPLLALLADGEAWSSSALALALGVNARTVQRALEELAGGERIRAIGQGRARRWMTRAAPGFPTVLLLPPGRPTG